MGWAWTKSLAGLPGGPGWATQARASLVLKCARREPFKRVTSLRGRHGLANILPNNKKRPGPELVRETSLSSNSPVMGPYSEEAKRSYEFARRVLSKIIKHPSPYLSSKDLKDLDIRCTGLDLETGKPTDGGVAFISPYPLTEIDRILHETKPWKLRKLPPKKDSMNMCAAMEIWGLLEEYLVMAEDKKVEGLIEQTKWKTRR
jgi:hypothetical protein